MLSVMPLLHARALSVVELLIETEVPTVPWLSVGVVPSSVYRIVAPARADRYRLRPL